MQLQPSNGVCTSFNSTQLILKNIMNFQTIEASSQCIGTWLVSSNSVERNNHRLDSSWTPLQWSASEFMTNCHASCCKEGFRRQPLTQNKIFKTPPLPCLQVDPAPFFFIVMFLGSNFNFSKSMLSTGFKCHEKHNSHPMSTLISRNTASFNLNNIGYCSLHICCLTTNPSDEFRIHGIRKFENISTYYKKGKGNQHHYQAKAAPQKHVNMGLKNRTWKATITQSYLKLLYTYNISINDV